jgi:hypothetical protein
MLNIYRPTPAELMAECVEALRRNKAMAPGPARTLASHFRRAADLKTAGVPPELSSFLSRTNLVYIGPRPAAFQKPTCGTPAYAIALKVGWITAEEEKADRQAWEERSRRSLQSCHSFSLYEARRFAPPPESGTYVPELAARLENDRNLTDGARRCARKIAEFAYRQNREEQSLDVTVTYLMKALGRCRRSVQRYLRLLEREGYIRTHVVMAPRSRMCAGLLIKLCWPLIARHHHKGWPAHGTKARRSPESLRNPDATKESHNKARLFIPNNPFSLKYYYQDKRMLISPQNWALRCMDGVFRSLMKTIPPLPASL